MKENQIVLPPDAKEKGVRIIPPQGCEVEKIETVDGVLTVMFKAKEPQLPKTWEEFCNMFPVNSDKEVYIGGGSEIRKVVRVKERLESVDRNVLPDRATAEAVLALCQLIQLRNAYNGDWVPDWEKSTDKIVIDFCRDGDLRTFYAQGEVTLLAFKDKETADEFLRNFRPLIEKLKPLYGIKEGGQND